MADKINYEPKGDRVLVTRLTRPEPTPGQVVTPKSQEKEFNEGIVVAVGPGNRNRVTGYIDEVDAKVGEHVCFLEYAGVEVEVDGVYYLSLREEEIHGQRPIPTRLGPGWGSLGEELPPAIEPKAEDINFNAAPETQERPHVEANHLIESCS